MILVVISLLLLKNFCSANFCHSTLSNGINIHVVPHSHDDVGWKETVNEYYQGHGQIQVKQIYDTVIEALIQNPQRK